KPWHIGFVVASPDPDRVKGLLDEYARRIAADYLAVLPPTEEPPA
ncbi:MAG: ATPase, partial [Thermomicrobiaceae bacterium]|nr:ATPase [Thermomicrobiaceae bacterium]